MEGKSKGVRRIGDVFIISVGIFLLTNTIAKSQFKSITNFGVSGTILLGTQNNSINISLKGSNVLKYRSICSELSIGVGAEVFISKYGVISVNKGFCLESYLLGGVSNKKEVNTFYSGGLYIPKVYGGSEINSFSAIGFGVNKKLIGGELKELANQRGMFLVRIKHKHDVFLLRITNDFRAGLMFGGGTDKGETGSIYFGWFYTDVNLYLHQIGINLRLITPVPDYSLDPNNKENSDDKSRPVLHHQEPYSNLFHGNLFFNYGLTNSFISQEISLGVDSRKLGGKLQNMLHDSFGLFPRFGWDKEAKNKLYFQSKTSGFYAK